MIYTPQQFFNLSALIESQGGEHLDRACVYTRYDEFSGPIKPEKPVFLAGCSNSVMFEIPYLSEDGTLQPIELCAVCDDLGRRPRFAEAMR